MNYHVLRALDDCYKYNFEYKNQIIRYLTIEEEKFGYHWNSAFSKLLRTLAQNDKTEEFIWQIDDFMKRKFAETRDKELEAAFKKYTNKEKDQDVPGFMVLYVLLCLFCPYIFIPLGIAYYFIYPAFINPFHSNRVDGNEQQ
uniref:Uncharacterized protein n=1 Tax=Panagrolaimus sp. PS1159 TaxID=55785 RepID=A0AC35FVY3_9BILA